jgi:predicted metal-binding protein
MSSVKSFSVSVLLQMGHCEDCSKCAKVQSIENQQRLKCEMNRFTIQNANVSLYI